MYGPCSLGVVSGGSALGISGINTENRPGSDVNRTQPLLSTTLLVFAGGLVGGAGVGVVTGGRGLCSWANKEKLDARVITAIARKLFIMAIL